MSALNDQQRDAIIASLYAGRKIEAIKQYRAATGVGLTEAKEFIDALDVRLREETPERFQTAPPGCSGGVVVLILLSAVLAALVGLALLIR